MEILKQCTKCGEGKPVAQFSWKNKRLNILHSRCKSCSKIERDDYYEVNKNYFNEKNKKNRALNKKWFDEYKKELKCKVCNESETCCLDFHHKDGDEKTNIISDMCYSTYSKKRIMEEINKCDVLCANCHRKVHNGIILI